jgi:hypothetical protein
MRLTHEQSRRLLEERGVLVTEACDRCGKLLGAVRWKRRSELGEWCSAACRDGIKAERSVSTHRQKRIGSRPSGRPKTYPTNAEKQRSYRGRLKNGLALRNTPLERIENAQLADAKKGSHVAYLTRSTQALETALSTTSPSPEGCA